MASEISSQSQDSLMKIMEYLLEANNKCKSGNLFRRLRALNIKQGKTGSGDPVETVPSQFFIDTPDDEAVFEMETGIVKVGGTEPPALLTALIRSGARVAPD